MTKFIIETRPLNPELQKYDAFWRPTDYAVLNGATRDNCIRPIIKKEDAKLIKDQLRKLHTKTYSSLLNSKIFYFGKIPQSALGSVAAEVADKWYNRSELEKSVSDNGMFDVYQFCNDWFTRTAPVQDCELSDGHRAVPDEHYWCRMTMIDWFEDPKTGNWISVSPLMPNTPEAAKQLLKLLQYEHKKLFAKVK